MNAMGGRAALESVHVLKLHGIQQRNMLEQSTRPEGPWIPDYRQFEETRDFDRHARHVKQSARNLVQGVAQSNSTDWRESGIIADRNAVVFTRGGERTPGPASELASTGEFLTLDPLRILLHAAAAPDLHVEPDVEMHGVRHHVLAWEWNGKPLRVLINANSGLPDEIEWTRAYPYSFYLSVWGDIENRLSFDVWMLEPGGLRYPRLWSLERNGQLAWQISITSVALDPEGATVAAIPAAERDAFLARKRPVSDLPLGIAGQAEATPAEGIVAIPGYWNVGFVKQDDGVVILDAPIGSQYSANVLDEAARRFPDQPVKAVVTTSDAWPHIGGLREYVARGIPVYALDINQGILQRLVKARYESHPDTLQREPRKARWHWIGTRTTLGQGDNRMELIPVRGQAGERQMFVYFPQHRLLYTSDLMQPRSGDRGWFTEAFAAEAKSVVEREQLDVAQNFGMHYLPLDWSGVVDWLNAAAAD